VKKGITFGAFDLFHAGHVLMMQEARKVCDYLIVCIQNDPSKDRKDKNRPIQSIDERRIQIEACKYVDEVLVYDTEEDVLEILDSTDWDVRILGEEYRDKDFTGREDTIDRCYFNSRTHSYSSSELRRRVIEKNDIKKTDSRVNRDSP